MFRRTWPTVDIGNRVDQQRKDAALKAARQLAGVEWPNDLPGLVTAAVIRPKTVEYRVPYRRGQHRTTDCLPLRSTTRTLRSTTRTVANATKRHVGHEGEVELQGKPEGSVGGEEQAAA